MAKKICRKFPRKCRGRRILARKRGKSGNVFCFGANAKSPNHKLPNREVPESHKEQGAGAGARSCNPQPIRHALMNAYRNGGPKLVFEHPAHPAHPSHPLVSRTTQCVQSKAQEFRASRPQNQDDFCFLFWGI